MTMVESNGLVALSEDDVQNKLKAAIVRAEKAEKAFLRLKLEGFLEKIDNYTKIAEQEHIAKISLYNNIPEQMERVKEEFQKRSLELMDQKQKAKDVYRLCLEAIGRGMTMDELPSNTDDPATVRSHIEKKLEDRKIKTELQNNSPTAVANLKKATMPVDPGIQQNSYVQHASNAATNPSHMVNGGPSFPNMQQQQQQQQAMAVNGGVRHKQPSLTYNQQQYNVQQNLNMMQQQNAVQQQHSVARQQQNAPQPQQHSFHSQQQQYPGKEQMKRYPSIDASQYYQGNPIGNALQQHYQMPSAQQQLSAYQQRLTQQRLNDGIVSNGAISSDQLPQKAVKGGDYTAVNGGSVAAAPVSYGNAAAMSSSLAATISASDTTASATSSDIAVPLPGGVSDLDDFIIEDGMFAAPTSQEPNAASRISRGNLATTSTNNTEEISSQGAKARNNRQGYSTDGESTKSNSDEDSVSDDEEFARKMALRQGTATRAAASPGPATTVRPRVTPAEKSNAALGFGKADPAEEEEITWTKEPLLSVVNQLAAYYKVSKSIAKKVLSDAAVNLGGVNELDRVYAEAERSIKNALKPSPLQPKIAAASGQARQAGAAPKIATSITGKNPTSNNRKTEGGQFSNYKSVMCTNWSRDRKCPKGDYCTFAHGKGDLRAISSSSQATVAASAPSPNSFYKVILCRNYETDGYCGWEDSCIFAHGAADLRTPSTVAPAAPTDQSESSNICHPEPCDNQQCPGKLEYLLKKTTLCDRNKQNLCIFGTDCKFAHSKRELKSMPKWEMCQRNAAKKCRHQDHSEKCVYAHSAHELKKKPAAFVNAARTAQSFAYGGKPIQSGRNYVPWVGNDKHPTTPKDTEECSICMGPLYPGQRKDLLKCGHNSFHEKCISQWVNEGMPSCPICREPAKLPDLFQAPAGFQPEEFPGLGL